MRFLSRFFLSTLVTAWASSLLCCQVNSDRPEDPSVSATNIIPADRRIDWTDCGIPGGIPNRTQVYTSLSPGATTAQINAAISSCPSDQVVYLNAGTYNLSGSINLGNKTGVTLRGAGAGKTIINVGKVTNADIFDSGTLKIASGHTKGSASLVMSSTPTGFDVGRLIRVSQNDDASLIMTRDAPGSNFNTMHRITGKSGNTLTIDPPLPYTLTAGLNPRAAYLSPTGTTLCGIEDMTLNHTGSEDFIEFWTADRCWLKNLEVYNAQNAFSYWVWCFQCEVRRCYFHHARNAPNNADGYAVYLYDSSTYCLVEDCVFNELWGGVLMTASSCNAVLYNFLWEMTAQGLPWQVDALNCNHGAHGMMSLWEGNMAEQFMNDGYHGTGSHQTLFRNWIHGLHPDNTLNRIMVNLNRGSYYHNVVGNVLGASTWNAVALEMTGDPEMNNGYIYRLGYPNMGNNDYSAETAWPLYNGSYPDAKVKTTLLRHGNYDYLNRATVWDPAISDQTLPASLFYSSKPSYFGSLQWPPFGPDVPGYAAGIPAQTRWEAFLGSGKLSDLF